MGQGAAPATDYHIPAPSGASPEEGEVEEEGGVVARAGREAGARSSPPAQGRGPGGGVGARCGPQAGASCLSLPTCTLASPWWPSLGPRHSLVVTGAWTETWGRASVRT